MPFSPESRFSELYRQHYAQILAYFRRRVPAANAEDLCAETFGRAWYRFATLQNEDKPLPWLYGIARHVTLEFYRQPVYSPVTEDNDVGVASLTDAVDLSLDLRRALDTLDAEDVELLTLHAWEGLRGAELAEALGVSHGTARVRLHRARSRLSRAMQANPESITALSHSDSAEGSHEHARTRS